MPENVKNLLQKAYNIMQSGNIESAQHLYEEILEAAPNNLTALNTLGFILYIKGSYEKGASLCRKTIELYPDNAYARKGLGLHLAKQGHIAESISSLKKALEIDPDFVDAYHDLAYVYYENGDKESALKYLEDGYSKIRDEKYRPLFDKFLNIIKSKNTQQVDL